jgi:hypothetical protein
MLTTLELFTAVGAWLYWKTRAAFALGHGGLEMEEERSGVG